jgi:hypothetical protein
MTRFQPKGDRSQRSIIASIAAEAAFGQLLTFEHLAQSLGISGDPDLKTVIRAAVTAARPLLLRDYGRVLIAARGQGYRVGKPSELAVVAQGHRMRADRQMGRALEVVTHGDTTGMTDSEYQRFMATRTIIVGLHRRMTAVEDRIERIEAALFGEAEPAAPVDGEVITSRYERPVKQPAWPRGR